MDGSAAGFDIQVRGPNTIVISVLTPQGGKCVATRPLVQGDHDQNLKQTIVLLIKDLRSFKSEMDKEKPTNRSLDEWINHTSSIYQVRFLARVRKVQSRLLKNGLVTDAQSLQMFIDKPEQTNGGNVTLLIALLTNAAALL